MAYLASAAPSLQHVYRILNLSRSLYPAIILGIFLVSFITFGVINSPKNGDKITVRSMQGPGGRPLPTRRKSNNQIKDAVSTRDFSPSAKTAFAILTSGIILAFVANGVATMIQVITYRDEGWWPGQSAIVSASIWNFVFWLTYTALHCRIILFLGNSVYLDYRHGSVALMGPYSYLVHCPSF